MLFGDGIFFKLSEDADFSARRKALASSLFKNKLTLMMNEIKRVTLDHLGFYFLDLPQILFIYAKQKTTGSWS